MERQLTPRTARPIFQILMEIAKGNFSYKIPRSDNRDLLGALYEQANMTVQDLEENFKHLAYVNPHMTYQLIIHSIIVLNQEEIISACTPSILNYKIGKSNPILGKPFKNLLTKSSLKNWEKAISKFKSNPDNPVQSTLELEIDEQLVMPQNCYIKKMETNSDDCYIAVSFFQNKRINDPAILNESKETLSKWDVMALQQVHDYIQRNVGKPRVSNAKLAEKFYINKHRLQKGFIKLFGLTPFQYYNILRLEEARYRIINTYQTLEVISSDLGFKSYTQFSAKFKSHFNRSPGSYRE